MAMMMIKILLKSWNRPQTFPIWTVWSSQNVRHTKTYRQRRTETVGDRQRRTKTYRDRQRKTEMDGDRQRHTETDRDGDASFLPDDLNQNRTTSQITLSNITGHIVRLRQGRQQAGPPGAVSLVTRSGTHCRSIAVAAALPTTPSDCGCMRRNAKYNWSASSSKPRCLSTEAASQPEAFRARHMIHAFRHSKERTGSSLVSPIVCGVIVLLIVGLHPKLRGSSVNHRGYMNALRSFLLALM